MTKKTIELLNKFYGNDIPDYVKDATKQYITISVSFFEEEKNLKVTIPDVIKYYVTQAPNITSGCRTLAGLTGDWRPIDTLAHECLDYFKFVNIEELRKQGKQAGIEPKF